jgi:hypothetical protein
MSFLALLVSLSTKQTAGRMRIWRALRTLGSVTLRDGVYLLPDFPTHAESFEQIAADVRALGGTAEIFQLDGRNDDQRVSLITLFDRNDDYASLIESIAGTDSGDPKALRALRRTFDSLSAIDFFPGEAQRQAESALAALEATANGEPQARGGTIRRHASADFQSRTWATRKHPWVDRLASAWLIQRHIDPKARFIWLDDPKRCPKNAIGFDFDGATFTHIDGLVTFEVLAASFGLDNSPAIHRIAAIVHFLDVGGVPVPEAAGIKAVLAGARSTAATDDALFADAGRLFDNLQSNFLQERPRD